MKALLIIISLVISFKPVSGQEDSMILPLDPYPVWGRIWEQTNTLIHQVPDTIFINSCKVLAIADGKVIAAAITDIHGKYELHFPVRYYNNNMVVIRTDCAGYVNLEIITNLYSTFYAANGQSADFKLNRRKE